MDERSERFLIERSLPGQRLDKVLAARYPAASRGTVQRLIEEGHILVNGRTAKPTHAPRAGEEITVNWPAPRPATAQAEAIPLEILLEDEDLLVLNKATGMVVHPAAGNEEHTLVNALLHHCQGRLSGIGGVARPGIVHRLDKETSGCLIVAKNDASHLALSAQFAERSTEKSYVAILCGQLPRDSGRQGEGREALTHYQVRERLLHSTLVDARLHTGRTHQIRVHFQHIGFPVAGDTTYGPNETKLLEERTGYHAPRVLLHAHKLAFVHPRTGDKQTVTAPWPADFQEAIDRLRPPE